MYMRLIIDNKISSIIVCCENGPDLLTYITSPGSKGYNLFEIIGVLTGGCKSCGIVNRPVSKDEIQSNDTVIGFSIYR